MVRQRLKVIIILFTVAVLILDSRTALQGAAEGIQLCLQTLIPGLFPLIFAITLLTSSLPHLSSRISRPLCKLYLIPEGSEGLLLTGLLGGYPVGAQTIVQAVHDGGLVQEAAQQMLVFCNACGPAFIFGIGSHLFSNHWVPWIIWIIHILSGLLTARLLNSTFKPQNSHPHNTATTIQEGLHRAIRSISQICGWVILMRILIKILQHWLLWCLPPLAQIICIGLLELSNGCVSLTLVANDGLRFILYAAFIGFGGICVVFQSIGISPFVSSELYLPGKLLQCSISTLLAGLLCPLLLNFDTSIALLMAISVILIPVCLFWIRKKQNKARILLSVGV